MKTVETIKHYCKSITPKINQLMEALEKLENCEDDEEAYTVMYTVRHIAEAMEKAYQAGMDDTGNDVLGAYEAVAQAIRNAKAAK